MASRISAEHQQKLAHRHDVQHLRVDRNQDCSSRCQSGEGQIPKLRWAVEDDDIVRSSTSAKAPAIRVKNALPALRTLVRHRQRRVVLEFLKFEICWNDVQTWKVGGPYQLRQRNFLIVVSYGVVDRFGLIKFGLKTMKRRKRSLRVEIDGQNAMARQGKILGKVRRRRRLSRAALEIHNSDHLQMLAISPTRNVPASFRSTMLVEVLAKF